MSNLKSVPVTGKSGAAEAIDALKNAFSNGIGISDGLFEALSLVGADKKFTVTPEAAAEMDSILDLVRGQFEGTAHEVYPKALSDAFGSAPAPAPAEEEAPAA